LKRLKKTKKLTNLPQIVSPAEWQRARDQLLDRHNPTVRKRLSGPAIRSFFRICKAWKLTVEEEKALLGWPATSTLYKYKQNDISTLSYKVLIRISLVLGIYDVLHIQLSEPFRITD